MLNILQPHIQVRTFWVLFAFTVLTLIGMQITGAPLKTAAAPGGIITFELAGSLAGSQAIIESWQGDTMTWAGINMGLDFLFLTLYGLTIGLGCLLISERLSDQWQTLKQVGVWLSVGVLFAAFLDVIENIALIKLLLGSQSEFLPVLAKWTAIPKFILVLLSLLYVIGGLVPVWKKSSA